MVLLLIYGQWKTMQIIKATVKLTMQPYTSTLVCEPNYDLKTGRIYIIQCVRLGDERYEIICKFWVKYIRVKVK